VFSGSFGDTTSTTKNYAQVTFLEVNLELGARVAPDFPPDYNVFLMVLQGKGFAGVTDTSYLRWRCRISESSKGHTVGSSAALG
jgi:redox-sensitive bicupin YhaK (pirin superfamily)